VFMLVLAVLMCIRAAGCERGGEQKRQKPHFILL
jgi:hypothetical protein